MPIDLTQGSAQLGIAKPFAAGRVIARGNCLAFSNYGSDRVAFIGLAEGEWDSIEKLFIDSLLFDHTDAAHVHFHPGVDGPTDGDMTPTSTGGDNRVDAFWDFFPAALPRLPFSRLSYLGLCVPTDPGAPSADLDWLGHYRTIKCRIFDAAGNQTDYRWTANAAWVAAELYIRTVLKREALIGAGLTAAEKKRIDFAALADTAAWCDDYVNGAPRWEANVAFPERTTLAAALSQITVLSQAYLIEDRGKMTLRPDKARASVFIVSSGMLDNDQATLGFQAKKNLRTASNRFIAHYRDLLPKKTAEIDTIARVGGTVTVTTKADHPYVAQDDIETEESDGPLNGIFRIATVPDARHFTYAQAGADLTSNTGWIGTLASRYTQRTSGPVDHLAHQLAIGQLGSGIAAQPRHTDLEVDFGNNLDKRCQTLLGYYKVRKLGPDTIPYQAPFDGVLRLYRNAVDVNAKEALAVRPGDVLTLSEDADPVYAGDFEVIERLDNPETGAESGNDSGVLELTVKEVVPEAWV